jgi:hypothetical protein
MYYNIPSISKHERNDAIGFYSFLYDHSMNSEVMQNINIEYSTEESQNIFAMPASCCHVKDVHSGTPSYTLTHSIKSIVITDSAPKVHVRVDE